MGLVTVRSFRDPVAAELAKSLLESRGIPAFVFDQHVTGIYWLYSYALGGVRVKVDQSELESAREALRSSEGVELAANTEEEEPGDEDACPACGSHEVETAPAHRIASAASLWIGLPLLPWRRLDHCRSCGHTWKPAPSERAEIPAETIEAEELVHERAGYPVRAYLLALVGFLILWYVRNRIRYG
jgi:hypothetical protein